VQLIYTLNHWKKEARSALIYLHTGGGYCETLLINIKARTGITGCGLVVQVSCSLQHTNEM